MGSKVIRRYLTAVLIYTIVYVVVWLMLDVVFNGIVLDYLSNHLPYGEFLFINHNRGFFLVALYILGFVCISMLYVFRLSRLLDIAGRSFQDEHTVLYGKKCPEELREFGNRLKAFQYNLQMNEQARQMAEQQKNDLVVYLAHDLKTPLTSVIGYLSLLEEASDLPVEQRAKYIGIALDKAYRLEHLINEFFDITRLNLQTLPAQKSQLNLTMFLSQILMEFAPMFEEKKIHVVEDLEPKLMVMADGDKLARVFDNLFRNAVNYSHSDTNMVCSARKDGDTICIVVRNMGDQISPEKLAHIFDKFYRLDQSRQSSTGGSGLGLAIAKQIVELHDGTIGVTCEAGVIEFTIVLPA